jgi:hypothetical protein
MNDLLYGADRAFEAVPSKLAPDLAEGSSDRRISMTGRMRFQTPQCPEDSRDGHAIRARLLDAGITADDHAARLECRRHQVGEGPGLFDEKPRRTGSAGKVGAHRLGTQFSAGVRVR